MDLSDRMKLFEDTEAQHRLMPLVPVMARLDGRNFHTFTKGLERPFSPRLMTLMQSTARVLMIETNANMAYTQSDEITLTWLQEKIENQIFFDARVQKMTSQLAAIASVHFNKHLGVYLNEKMHLSPTFDARVWSVPNREEGANVFLWREKDATKNSVTMAAQALFSHKELHGKSGKEKIEMMFQKGVDWNAYPSDFRRGSYFQRRSVVRPFTGAELARLPTKHEARKDPKLKVSRTEYRKIDMPIFWTVKNRAAVVYSGEEPVVLRPLQEIE